MKFSLEFSRSKRAEKPAAPKGGDLIRSSVALPEHAEALRQFREINQRGMRAYEAAMSSNLNSDFSMTAGSANAEILTSLYISRGRARTLVKDNAIAKNAVRARKNNVCGEDPFRLEMRVGKYSADGKTFTLETETNRKIKTAWEKAGRPKNCTVRRDMSRLEMYHCLEASEFRDGNVLLRHHRAFDNEFGYAAELIESDRLQESFNGTAANGNRIRFSIERDRFNAPVAYWLLTRHPGDLFQTVPRTTTTFRERVPADEIILFSNMRDRAEQDIGFPEFDSVIQELHLSRQFDRAHVTAAIWAACNPLFLVKEIPTGMQFPGDPSMFANQVGEVAGGTAGTGNAPAAGDGKGGGANKIEIVEPGTGRVLDYGIKPMMPNPKFPVEAAVGFRRDRLMAAAAGLGLDYGTISADFEKYSFSTARFAVTPARDNFKVYQNHMILVVVRDHFCEWLKYALISGAIDLPFSRYEEFCDAASFIGKRWPYIQPQQDAVTDIELREANLKSSQEILNESENGRDFEEVVSDLAAERQILKDHGIDPDAYVTKPTLPKGEPGETKTDDEGKTTLQKNRLNGNGAIH